MKDVDPNLSLQKIISGGQTGADRAGLLAAKALGLETGGFIPKDFRTENGPEPELGERFGLTEIYSFGYKHRTRLNVQMGDGTALFGRMSSPGSRQTLNMCDQEGKPFVVNPNPDQLHLWLKDNDIEVLNVAGNRESKNRGIASRVMDTIISAVSPHLFTPSEAELRDT